MDAVNDFKSIRRKLDRQDQKVEFEQKNPPAPMWFNMPIAWTPEDGYSREKHIQQMLRSLA